MLHLVSDRLESPLPTETDFDPFSGDLDAQHAWRVFGNLSLHEAYAKFCKLPEVHQEDFMFMGCRAFHYYFPVVEEYLRNAQATDQWDDCSADILGSCVAAQFDWKGAALSEPLRQRIRSLCDFVLENVERLALSSEVQERVRASWRKVSDKLEKKTAEPGATDNPDDAQRLREDH